MATELPAPDNWEVPQGDDFAEEYQYCDDDEVGIDISAATIVCKIKNRALTTTYATLTTANGGVTVDNEGNFVFIMTSTTTAALSFTDTNELGDPEAVFDSHITLSGGAKKPLIRGKVTLILNRSV